MRVLGTHRLRGLKAARLCRLNGRKKAYALFLFCAATAIALPAQTFTNLVNFNLSNGAAPSSPLVQGLDGKLYGTTSSGGANGLGTVFKITSGGMLTPVYSFCSQTNCTDGTTPFAGLALDTTGNFDGTTANSGANGFGGTVFKITPAGRLTTLHNFCSRTNCTDGNSPFAGLVQATNGNFYGTTVYGGAFGGGTVFKITPGGTLTTLHSFCAKSKCTDGQSPIGGLIQAIDGNFYGTTASGGAKGAGTVFKITQGGILATLHSFCAESNCIDGKFPNAGLVQAANGDFYGTTVDGGAGNSDLCSPTGFAQPCGTVFEITSGGVLTTLYSFCSETNCTDGGLPRAPLIQATDGNFYSTTTTAGRNGNGGTVFRITPTGTLTTLYSFCAQTNCTDGNGSEGGLFQATNGTLYGTTLANGANQEGTVFSLEVGLGPFIETLPTSGKVGATIKILGNNLKGTTHVRFNGIAAGFTVVSNSYIKTTVPNGATTGFVAVTTPTGTLKSNKKFRPL